ncbi:hypothetical protein VB714_11030 [Spirulina sp. 06S082]|nr:hypothetical protein [Spirulina sp. 06S082]
MKPIRYWYDRGLREKIEKLKRDQQEAKQEAIQREREDIQAKENIRRKKEYMKQDTLQMQIQMLQMQQTSQQALILVLIGAVIIMSVALGTQEQIAQEEIEYLREQLQGRSVCDQWMPPDYCFRYR